MKQRLSPLTFILLLGIIWQSCENGPDAANTQMNNNMDSTTSAAYYQETHRPQFHFSPAEKWMNDPNGMVYFEGEYHLFYQYYPDSTVWGPMHWAHAVSKDLVHWEHLPVALYPDSLGYIFSGSAVVDWNNTSGLGKDGAPPLIAIFTYHDPLGEKAERSDFQYQAIAYSHDKGRSWTKYEGNPVIPNPNNIRDFRDPKVIWDEAREQWLMVFAAYDYSQFWASKNLIDWTHLSNWGKEYGEHGGVWECPDIFPMTVEETGEQKWVLIQSLNPGGPNGGSATQYFVGDFDGTHFSLDPDFAKEVVDGKAVWLDYGRDNYAGVTWADIPREDGRKLFLGWMSNWDYAQVVPTEKWRSAMTVPRGFKLRKTEEGYRLYTTPVKELTRLRKTAISLKSTELSDILDLNAQEDFNAAQVELVLEFDLTKNQSALLGLELSNSLGELYRFGVDLPKQRFFSDRTKAGDHSFSDKFAKEVHFAPYQGKGQRLKLHCFIDAASIEVFADDGACVMTEVFFPSEDFNRLALFSEGGASHLESGVIYPLERIWK